jgi:hypothetical protein
MRAYLNQTLYIPFAPNQAIASASISIMKLSDGSLVVSTAGMTSQPTNNIWTYAWTTPAVVETYQVVFVDSDGFQHAGPIIEVGGGIIFTIQADGGNTAATFKTDLTATTNDHYLIPAIVRPLTGALADQTRRLATSGAYNGTTKFLTVSTPFTAVPAAGVVGLLLTG